jgi:hypothetical protein
MQPKEVEKPRRDDLQAAARPSLPGKEKPQERAVSRFKGEGFRDGPCKKKEREIQRR